MSHITDGKFRIKDLDTAAQILPEFGLELRRNKTDVAWWGKFVNDSNTYGEINPREFGKNTAHTIGRIGHAPVMGPTGEWEIALIKAPDGDGYLIGYDAFGAPGQRLEACAGAGLEKIRHAYTVAVARKALAAKLALQGFTLDAAKDLGNGRAVIRAWKL